MPATLPASQAETWVDSVDLRGAGKVTGDVSGVPSFALIETQGPAPFSLLLSTLILSALLSLTVMLGRMTSVSPTPRPEAFTLLFAPPLPMKPRASALKYSIPDSTGIRRDSDAAGVDVPAPASAQAPDAPPASLPLTSSAVAPQPPPPQALTPSAPNPIQPERAQPPAELASTAEKVEAPKPNPAPAVPASVNRETVSLARHTPEDDPTADARHDMVASVPEPLGGAPLSRLIEQQEGLAAGLAALPSTQRLGLPQVSIRVNAEWLAALPKTHERLYFSIGAPRPDGEVLAYLPDSHSFELERPEQPLWQIHDGGRVPALAELRASAGEWLGVSPELVGLYTWHPPVFEDALRMFVLERMQEVGVHLGPRDLVTVRLSPSAGGTVMNLEPIHPDDSVY